MQVLCVASADLWVRRGYINVAAKAVFWSGIMNPLQCMLNFAVPLEGVIHVGANHGREYVGYSRSTAGLILFLEAIPRLVTEIEEKLDKGKPHFVRQAVVGADAGKVVQFNIASNDGRSSSFLELGRHGELRPEVIYVETFEDKIQRLDAIVIESYNNQDFNFLAIDTQGADLEVLKGSEAILDRIDAVYIEISIEPLYTEGCTFLQIYQFLESKGFLVRHVELNGDGWGNAFFASKRTRLHDFAERSLALGKPATQSSVFGKYYAARGVNGDLTSSFNTHTGATDQAAWWQVDMEEEKAISRILFVDRPQFDQRSKTLKIEISRDGVAFRQVFDRTNRNVNGLIDIKWTGKARFIRLSLQEPGPLHFRQLIVL